MSQSAMQVREVEKAAARPQNGPYLPKAAIAEPQNYHNLPELP